MSDIWQILGVHKKKTRKKKKQKDNFDFINFSLTITWKK